MSTTKPITSLADLTKLTKASLSGGLVSEEYFYKANEVEALVAHLKPETLADATLTAQRDQALEAADQLYRSGFINDTRRADMRRRISLHFKKALQKGQADA